MPAPRELTEDVIARLLQPLQSAPQWVVGFSGGLDSTVLLHICSSHLARLASSSQYAANTLPKLSALHVDHQLMPDHQLWTKHCEAYCNTLDIPLALATVDIESKGGGIEQAARTERYQVFTRAIERPDSVLMLAHHQDDQAETLLLRLFRGSGTRGAAAMQATRPFAQGVLVRPLLDYPRSALEAYAQSFALDYIEDPSNTDERLDRNYVRKQVLPTIASRWPKVNTTLARFASHAGINESLLRDLAAIDFAAVRAKETTYGEHLCIESLSGLPHRRRLNLYRYWLDQLGWLMPSTERLAQVDDLACNNRSSSAVHFDGFSLRVHDSGLYCVSDQWLAALEQALDAQPPWDALDELLISRYATLSGCSMRDEAVAKSGGLAAGNYTVGPRREGATCRVNGMTKTLKKLLQEAGIPAWLRDAYPVIYAAGVEDQPGETRIAAVAGICVCDNYCAGNGIKPTWHYHFPPNVATTL